MTERECGCTQSGEGYEWSASICDECAGISPEQRREIDRKAHVERLFDEVTRDFEVPLRGLSR